MRIVIDMQSLQLDDYNENDLNFIIEVIKRHKDKHDFFIALNGMISKRIQHLRNIFRSFICDDNIRTWYYPESKKNDVLSDSLTGFFFDSFEADIIYKTFSYSVDAESKLCVRNYSVNNKSTTFVTVILDEKESFQLLDINFLGNLDFIFKKTSCNYNNVIYPNIENNKTEDFLYFNDTDVFLENLNKSSIFKKAKSQLKYNKKPTLAYVSPLPPLKTGIAEYSAELLEVLNTYYEIYLVVDQKEIEISFKENYIVKDKLWLELNWFNVDRIVYHIGNSYYHGYMVPLLTKAPGLIVLHDFYIGHLWAWLEQNLKSDSWNEAIYRSHGYIALLEKNQNIEKAIFKYPCGLPLIQNSLGVIVHSDFSRDLSKLWYGEEINKIFKKINHLRALPSVLLEKSKMKENLGYSNDSFIICSFGFIGSTKYSKNLLTCWLKSGLSKQEHNYLIFVGENDGGQYGSEILKIIKDNKLEKKVIITGFTPSEKFKQYLNLADIAVQLRNNSRGETSGTILDCMSYETPLIINAHGTNSELEKENVWMLDDNFQDIDLITAIQCLQKEVKLRKKISKKAKEFIIKNNDPKKIANEYYSLIEDFYREKNSYPSFFKKLLDHDYNNEELLQIAQKIAINNPLKKAKKRLLIDITVTSQDDYKTGIQRVVRAITLELLKSSQQTYQIEPVKLSCSENNWCYVTIPSYVGDLLGMPSTFLESQVIEPESGDVILILDLTGSYLINAQHAGFYEKLKDVGTKIFSIVYDILPITIPSVFPKYAEEEHKKWVNSICTLDGIIGISQSVVNEFNNWKSINISKTSINNNFKSGFFHLGADICNSSPSKGMPHNHIEILEKIKNNNTFLMVGTIEPRKGYLQVLRTFEYLWDLKVPVNLVIIGQEGWKKLDSALRRDIPQTIESIINNKYYNKNLFWFNKMSDEFLEKFYDSSTCLIAASYGEGFGLPLIEAAQHKIPIIARDIPVFREVAGEHAFYFDGSSPEILAETVQKWLNLYSNKQHPTSDAMPWLTWKESAQQLMQVINQITCEH